jgi:hypothetical protein
LIVHPGANALVANKPSRPNHLIENLELIIRTSKLGFKYKHNNYWFSL